MVPFPNGLVTVEVYYDSATFVFDESVSGTSPISVSVKGTSQNHIFGTVTSYVSPIDISPLSSNGFFTLTFVRLYEMDSFMNAGLLESENVVDIEEVAGVRVML